MNTMQVIIIVGPALCLVMAGYAIILARRAKRSLRQIGEMNIPHGIVPYVNVRIGNTFQFMPTARGYRLDIIDMNEKFVGAVLFEQREEMEAMAKSLFTLIADDKAAALIRWRQS